MASAVTLSEVACNFSNREGRRISVWSACRYEKGAASKVTQKNIAIITGRKNNIMREKIV
jgi:hypothetical protein